MVIYLAQNQLDFVKRIEWKKGDRFSFGGDGGVEYSIQSIGDIVECRQHARDGKSTAFPAVVYLTLNQLDYVQFTKKEEGFKVGDHLVMGGVEYVIERMGDIVECKQPGDGGDFPKVVFLAVNQLQCAGRK